MLIHVMLVSKAISKNEWEILGDQDREEGGEAGGER
jgi:hypothetical protein